MIARENGVIGQHLVVIVCQQNDLIGASTTIDDLIPHARFGENCVIARATNRVFDIAKFIYPVIFYRIA